MKKFIINGQYQQLLKKNGFDIIKILRVAKLPENIFTHEHIRLTEQEYYTLMNTIASQATDQLSLVNMSTYDGIETFSAPILAAYCSENGIKFIERLGKYKQLIGPIEYQIHRNHDLVTVSLKSLNGIPIESKFYVISELIFLINLISKATGENIKPVKITSTFDDFSQFLVSVLKVKPIVDKVNSITFKVVDLELPFLTNNAGIRSYLTPEISRRLSELEIDESVSNQVRSILVDLLPAGETTIEDVARKLNVNKRTLQRRLKEENTSFQKQLNDVREMLAKSYIKNTTLSSNEIAYLLGYLEINSFLRAFTIWTGMSFSEYQKTEHD